MSETISCDEARRLLALGEPEAEAHVRACEACRLESAHHDRVLGFLRSEPEAGIPDHLDRMLREAILSAPPARAGVLRPGAALALATGALAALGSGAAIVLAQAGLGAAAPVAALLAIGAYLTLSSATTLPLLLRAGFGTAPAEVTTR